MFDRIKRTGDLFWQASAGIDGGPSSKSIAFVPTGGAVELAKFLTVFQAYRPTMAEAVMAHATAIRHLGAFLKLLADSFQYDEGSDLHDPSAFRDLLQVCKVLLWSEGAELWADTQDRKHWTSHDYWVAKSDEEGWDGLVYITAQPIVATLLPALVRSLRGRSDRVIAGKLYWAHRDPEYLALVYEAVIPDVDDKDGLIGWAYDYDRRSRIMMGLGADFARRALVPARGKASRGTTLPASPDAWSGTVTPRRWAQD